MPQTPEEIRTYQREWKRRWRAKNRATHNAMVAAWNARNPEKKKASDQASYIRRRDKILAQKHVYYLDNLEKLTEKNHEYREENKEALRAYYGVYYLKNLDKITRKSIAYRETHQEELALYQREYRRAHPEKSQTNTRQRRAQKANAPQNDLTHAQWLEIQAAQDHCCYYCGKRCKGKLTQDHIIPLSKGGSHTVSNVIGACRSCNSKKHDNAPPIPVQPFLLTIAPAKKQKKAL